MDTIVRKYKVAYILSHPIQYHTPLIKKLSNHSGVDLVVYYFSDYGVVSRDGSDKRYHKEGGVLPLWDVPLLDGYKYKFIKNLSPLKPIEDGFFSLFNPSLFFEFLKNRCDVIIVNGTHYLSYILAIIFAKILGIKVLFRGDNPLFGEYKKSKYKILFKRFLYGKVLFPLIDRFLYVGEDNKEYFKFYGVKGNKLYYCPHSVDNDRFSSEYRRWLDLREKIKNDLNLSGKVIVLFSAVLVKRKGIFELINAFSEIKNEDAFLLIVGDGVDREKTKDLIKRNNLEKKVYFAGFVNQSEISKYYSIADIFVLPSHSDTWGLVVNEAMNFSLPVIVSDQCGCAKDLVKGNGFIIKAGDVNDLKEKLETLINDSELRKEMGRKSMEIIRNYSYDKAIDGILNAISSLKIGEQNEGN